MKYDAILADLRRHGDTLVGPPDVMAAAEKPDARVGRYVVVAQLGRGGAGTVYRAWDPGPGRFVALKVLNRDAPAVLERFKREAQIAARLRHPGIVPVHEVGEDAGRHFIAMELVDGAAADARRMRPREAADVVRQAALAIQAAHDHGVIHRDVKPSNILIDRAGRAYVSDFGLARWVEASRSLTDSDMVMGTPGFMSPEQVRDTKHVDARADVYGLGATLYRLATGRVPHAAATTFETLKRTLEEELAMPRGVLPRDLEAVIQVAMAKEPDKRYATARALAEDLKRFLEGDPVAAHPPSFGYRMRKRLAKRKLVVALAGVVAALAIVLGIVVPQWRAESEELALQAELKPVEEAIKYARPYLYARSLDIVARIRAVESAVVRLEALTRARRWEGRYEVWKLLGAGWHFVGDGDQAERALMQAQRLRPDDSDVELMLARLCLERALARTLSANNADDPELTLRRQYWTRRATDHIRRARVAGDLEQAIVTAYAAYADGDGPRLRRECNEALSRFGSREGTEELLLMRSHAESRDEGVETLTQALERRPHYAWARFLRGNAHLAAGRLAEARADFDAVIAMTPRLAEAWNNRGNCRTFQGDVAGALQDYNTAIAMRPGWGDAYANRGTAHNRSGNWEAAIANYSRAIEACPDDPYLWCARAWARMERNEHAAAAADLDRALELAPNYALAYANRGAARRQLGDLAGAGADFDRAIATDSSLGVAHVMRGTLRLESGDVPGALSDLRRAIDLNPREPNARCALGSALKHTRDLAGAAEQLDEAIRLKPDYADAWYNRSTVCVLAGDRAAAKRHIDRAVELEPQRAEFVCARGAIRALSGDVDGGLDDFNRALELSPKYADGYHNRGLAWLDKRDWVRARADFDEAIRLNPGHADALANRGDLRRVLGDLRGCIEDWEAALRVAPLDWAVRARVERGLEQARRETSQGQRK